MKTKLPDTSDLTLRKLQTTLPWGLPYSAAFVASEMRHKDFAHALTHALKALGKLAELVEAEDRGKDALSALQAHKYIADLIICAARMSTTIPPYSVMDLESAVIDRIETKNGVWWDNGKWEPIREDQ